MENKITNRQYLDFITGQIAVLEMYVVQWLHYTHIGELSSGRTKGPGRCH